MPAGSGTTTHGLDDRAPGVNYQLAAAVNQIGIFTLQRLKTHGKQLLLTPH